MLAVEDASPSTGPRCESMPHMIGESTLINQMGLGLGLGFRANSGIRRLMVLGSYSLAVFWWRRCLEGLTRKLSVPLLLPNTRALGFEREGFRD